MPLLPRLSSLWRNLFHQARQEQDLAEEEVRMGHQLETCWQDLRYALRTVRRNPGLAAVVVLTLALGARMKGFLFELSVTDPPTFTLITALLLGVAFLACYLPARGATKVDPITALRRE